MTLQTTSALSTWCSSQRQLWSQCPVAYLTDSQWQKHQQSRMDEQDRAYSWLCATTASTMWRTTPQTVQRSGSDCAPLPPKPPFLWACATCPQPDPHSYNSTASLTDWTASPSQCLPAQACQSSWLATSMPTWELPWTAGDGRCSGCAHPPAFTSAQGRLPATRRPSPPWQPPGAPIPPVPTTSWRMLQHGQCSAAW